MGDFFIYGFLILFFGAIVVGCFQNLAQAAKENKASGGEKSGTVLVLLGVLAAFIYGLAMVIREAAGNN